MPTPQIRTSASGRAFLRREEGCVLRAYRDVTGTWTIGDGLTAASGVVVPKAGMVITQGEADRLLDLALARNYEPAVRRAMPGAGQAAFDAGVSFHWNTGAILSASWVRLWRQRQWAATRTALLAWCKSKGRVIPGLTARRGREFALLRDGAYGAVAPVVTAAEGIYATLSSAITAEDLREARAGLARLGHAVGTDPDRIIRSALIAFQRDHDLTADGILGRATLATVRRMRAARTEGLTVAGVVTAAGAGTTALAAGGATSGWFDIAVLSGVAVIVLIAAWRRRDAIAAAIQSPVPRLAAWLRRI